MTFEMCIRDRTKAGMTDRAVFPQVKIEAVILFLQTQLLHTIGQLLQVVLSLASADDLADARYQADVYKRQVQQLPAEEIAVF